MNGIDVTPETKEDVDLVSDEALERAAGSQAQEGGTWKTEGPNICGCPG